jgi:hypothetical protein
VLALPFGVPRRHRARRRGAKRKSGDTRRNSSATWRKALNSVSGPRPAPGCATGPNDGAAPTAGARALEYPVWQQNLNLRPPPHGHGRLRPVDAGRAGLAALATSLEADMSFGRTAHRGNLR